MAAHCRSPGPPPCVPLASLPMADERARWFIQRVLMVPRSLLSIPSRMASLQVLQQLDVILSAGKVVSTGGSVSVMV